MAILSLSPRINNACGKKCLSAPKWQRVISIREGNLDSKRCFSVFWIMEQSKWPKVPWKRNRQTAVCVPEKQLSAESKWAITQSCSFFGLFAIPSPPGLQQGEPGWVSRAIRRLRWGGPKVDSAVLQHFYQDFWELLTDLSGTFARYFRSSFF